MKKLAIALLVLLLLTSVASAAIPHVADQANTFSLGEQQALETQMQRLYDIYGFDSVIVTTRDSRGQSARMYAADFYDEFRSYTDYPNGLIFSFNFDIGEYFEATRGIGETIFASQGEGQLDSLLRPYLEQRDYYGAMRRYLNYVETTLERYAVRDDQGRVTLSTQRQLPTLDVAARQALNLAPFMLGGGLLVGLAAAFGMKQRLLIAKPQLSAQSYARGNSVALTQSDDVFLYQTVSRTRIQENRSSGGGGGRSGGGSFRSSGGNSYGGRGGRL